jgi:hypothetical protein
MFTLSTQGKRFYFHLVSVICFLMYLPAHSQEADSLDYIEASNKVYQPNIKSVLFHRDGFELSPPLMQFNHQEQLRLSFDDLDADVKEFTFTIVHCDASWIPSELSPDRYINGFTEDHIYTYSFSQNTLVPYTHYEILFPTDDLKPAIAGNYILKVYDQNPENLYFTRRFMVFDQQVEITGQIGQASVIEDRKSKQKVSFEILSPSLRIANPYRDLKVVIVQNGRWDNRIHDLKPKMVVGNKLDYNYDYENVFDGGNEFRTVDIKSLNYNTENIAKIESDRDGYYVTLMDDHKRTYQVYKSESDINGRMIITTEDRRDASTESEYVNVHFFLSYTPPLMDGHIYIAGALTDWSYSEENRMIYNFNRKGYEKTLLLKQGYYNYQYMALFEHSKWGDVSFIEGNHWETGNDYTILIYYREPADLFERLIGVAQFNSHTE